MKILSKVYLLAIGLVLVALSQTASVSAAPSLAGTPVAATGLSGTSWVLTSLNGHLPLAGTTVTLELGADGTASGNDGCNQYSTTFATDGTSVTIAQPGASTMMACEGDVMQQAQEYMEALAATTTFAVNSRQLVLQNDGQILATFTAVSQDLAGSSWLVTAYNNGREAVVSLIVGTDINMDFGEDAMVSGNAGCNDYLAHFTAADGTIAVGAPGTTFRFCGETLGVMEQETEFLAAFTSATTYSISGNTLQMRTADDQLALMATRQPIIDLPTPPAAPATPWGRAIAPNGLNVRSGPGVNFPVIGVARFGDEGEIIGRSADQRWWAVAVPSAPNGTGWVSADFVLASNVENVPVIAAPPPPVIIPTAVPPPATPTPPPAATAPPQAQISFSADQTTIDQGQCTTLRWSAQNVEAVWVNPSYNQFDRTPRPTQGSQQVCPASTTTYEMRVLLHDGTFVVRTVTVNVNASATPQAQIAFWADSTNINQGQCTRLFWNVENVQGVWVYPQGANYAAYPRVGNDSEQVCPNSTTTYEMRVLMRDGTTTFRQVTINVNPVATAVPPTATAVPATATPAPPSNPLAGSGWNVTQLNNGNGITTMLAGTTATADFGADGQVSGTGGCNRYFGPYTVNGNSISIGPLGGAAAACSDPEGIMNQETALMAALQSAATFRIEGSTLTLNNGSGAIAVILTRAH